MTFSPSPEQSAIFDAIVAPNGGNLIVEAVAGSGKTTTIVEGLRFVPERVAGALLPSSICFLAFNKLIAETLKSRCPRHVSCSTFHSLGLRALRPFMPQGTNSRDWVNSKKCSKLTYALLDRDDPDLLPVQRLVSLAKACGVLALPNAPSLDEIVRRYDLEHENLSLLLSTAAKVLERNNANLSSIDFDDMLYLPVLLNATFPPMDWLFVDEAQDTNDIQLEILFRSTKFGGTTYDTGRVNPGSTCSSEVQPRNSNTRCIFVGDPNQAIYAFRGANADSMRRIASRFACRTFPLSVSYRCSKAVVLEAQKVLTKDQL